MPYPPRQLNRKKRIAIMISLIALFFIISPLLLLYTAGYRYDFKTGQLKETGVISIDAKPTDARVSLNGVALDNQLPIYLPNRAPGTYKIIISRDGYYDWNKEINVESQQTTYIKNILLFKKALPILIWDQTKFSNAELYPENTGANWLMLNQNNHQYFIKLISENGQTTNLWQGPTTIKPVISWSPFHNLAFVTISYTDHQTILLIDADNPGISKEFNIDLSTNKTLTHQWSKDKVGIYINTAENNDADHNNIIYYSLNEGIIENGQKTSSSVWYNEEGVNLGILWNINNNVKRIDKYFTNNYLNSLSLPRAITKIIDANQQRIIFLNDSNNVEVVVISNNKILTDTILPTSFIYYNNPTKEWLTWSPWELWSITNNGIAELLNRSGEKINFVLPLDKYGEYLLTTNNKLIGFNPGYALNQELLNNVEIDKIAANVGSRKIFFAGKVGQKQGIWELDY